MTTDDMVVDVSLDWVLTALPIVKIIELKPMKRRAGRLALFLWKPILPPSTRIAAGAPQPTPDLFRHMA